MKKVRWIRNVARMRVKRKSYKCLMEKHGRKRKLTRPLK
jgi:hypothetical protein